MTLGEAIKHCEEVAMECDLYKIEIEYKCGAEHRQFAAWLRELKELKEENKVLISECDRLIKEKGELLNKVSGCDVLRICQLEDRLQVELDNSHCLEIEFKEAKRLLKSAIDEWNLVCEWGKCGEYCGWYVNGKCTQEWSGKAEALKLIGEDGEQNDT